MVCWVCPCWTILEESPIWRKRSGQASVAFRGSVGPSPSALDGADQGLKCAHFPERLRQEDQACLFWRAIPRHWKRCTRPHAQTSLLWSCWKNQCWGGNGAPLLQGAASEGKWAWQRSHRVLRLRVRVVHSWPENLEGAHRWRDSSLPQQGGPRLLREMQGEISQGCPWDSLPASRCSAAASPSPSLILQLKCCQAAQPAHTDGGHRRCWHGTWVSQQFSPCRGRQQTAASLYSTRLEYCCSSSYHYNAAEWCSWARHGPCCNYNTHILTLIQTIIFVMYRLSAENYK